MTPNKNSLRALLQRGNLTGSAAAKIAGVNPRTVRRWIGGDSEIPYSAWTLIQQHVDQEEIAASATADHTAWIASMDADTAERAPLAALDEQIWTLRGIQQMQAQAVFRLEDELAEARIAHEQTTSRLNALYAERGKLEGAKQ